MKGCMDSYGTFHEHFSNILYKAYYFPLPFPSPPPFYRRFWSKYFPLFFPYQND